MSQRDQHLNRISSPQVLKFLTKRLGLESPMRRLIDRNAPWDVGIQEITELMPQPTWMPCSFGALQPILERYFVPGEMLMANLHKRHMLQRVFDWNERWCLIVSTERPGPEALWIVRAAPRGKPSGLSCLITSADAHVNVESVMTRQFRDTLVVAANIRRSNVKPEQDQEGNAYPAAP